MSDTRTSLIRTKLAGPALRASAWLGFLAALVAGCVSGSDAGEGGDDCRLDCSTAGTGAAGAGGAGKGGSGGGSSATGGDSGKGGASGATSTGGTSAGGSNSTGGSTSRGGSNATGGSTLTGGANSPGGSGGGEDGGSGSGSGSGGSSSGSGGSSSGSGGSSMTGGAAGSANAGAGGSSGSGNAGTGGASGSYTPTPGGSCPGSLSCPASINCGCYTVPGLSANKVALLNAGADRYMLASAMMETETMTADYAYGDNKTQDSFNAGTCKQNWGMMRECWEPWNGLGPGDYATSDAMNDDVALDVQVYTACRNHFGDRWWAGHRNGASGLMNPNTTDIQRFKTGMDWTYQQLEDGHFTDDVRFWVQIPAIRVLPPQRALP